MDLETAEVIVGMQGWKVRFLLGSLLVLGFMLALEAAVSISKAMGVNFGFAANIPVPTWLAALGTTIAAVLCNYLNYRLLREFRDARRLVSLSEGL